MKFHLLNFTYKSFYRKHQILTKVMPLTLNRWRSWFYLIRTNNILQRNPYKHI